MVRYISLLVFIGLAWRQENPCEDPRYLEIKVKSRNEVSESEYQYFLKKQEECSSFKAAYHPTIEKVAEFYPNGKKMFRGQMLDGKKHGTWYYYYEDGVTYKEQLTFKNGILDGEYNTWEKNGGRVIQGYYQDGVLHEKERKNQRMKRSPYIATQKRKEPKPNSNRSPCNDTKFLSIKNKSLDEMTNREYDYFMMMQEKCVSFSENNTNKKIKKKKPSLIDKQYCYECNKWIDENASVCPYCGRRNGLIQKEPKRASNTNNQTSNELGNLGNILLEAINEFSGANDFGPAGKCQYDDYKITKVLYGDNFKMENNRFFSKYECQAPINKHTYWLPD